MGILNDTLCGEYHMRRRFPPNVWIAAMVGVTANGIVLTQSFLEVVCPRPHQHLKSAWKPVSGFLFPERRVSHPLCACLRRSNSTIVVGPRDGLVLTCHPETRAIVRCVTSCVLLSVLGSPYQCCARRRGAARVCRYALHPCV